MASESRFTLFGGQTPEDVQRSINANLVPEALAASGGNQGLAGAAAAGNLIGRGIGSLFGREPTEVAAARKAKGIFDATPVSNDPVEYLQSLSSSLFDAGRPEQALNAMLMAEKLGLDRDTKSTLSAKREASIAQKNEELAIKQSNQNLKDLKFQHQQTVDTFNQKIDSLKAALAERQTVVQEKKAEADISLAPSKKRLLEAKTIAEGAKVKQTEKKLALEETKLNFEKYKFGEKHMLEKLKFETNTGLKKDHLKLLDKWKKATQTLEQAKLAAIKGEKSGKAVTATLKTLMPIWGNKDWSMEMLDSMIKSDDDLGAFWGGLSGTEREQLANNIRTQVLNDMAQASATQDASFDLWQSILKNFSNSTGRAPTDVATEFKQEIDQSDIDLMNQLLGVQ